MSWLGVLDACTPLLVDVLLMVVALRKLDDITETKMKASESVGKSQVLIVRLDFLVLVVDKDPLCALGKILPCWTECLSDEQILALSTWGITSVKNN